MIYPKHLAIIMDGNRRWAEQNKHFFAIGHSKGSKTAKNIILECKKLKIPYLTLFTLSTENISRPQVEVSALIQLFEQSLKKNAKFLVEENIKLEILGDSLFLPHKTKELLNSIKKDTSQNTGMTLILALNFGGRWDILQGVKKLLDDDKNQNQELTEESLASYLPSSQFPAPDLIIRSGGHLRMSNFYLWSAAYSEFYFTDCLWPDFDSKTLHKALEQYSKTERKFGVL